MIRLIREGRLPISERNVIVFERDESLSSSEIVNRESKDADLTILGINQEAIKQKGVDLFSGYEGIGNILFVNASEAKDIKESVFEEVDSEKEEDLNEEESKDSLQNDERSEE